MQERHLVKHIFGIPVLQFSHLLYNVVISQFYYLHLWPVVTFIYFIVSHQSLS